MKPAADEFLILLVQNKRFGMRGLFLRRDIDAGIFQSRQVKRLPDAGLCQEIAGQQFIRTKVCRNASLIHQNDPVDTAPEHIFKTVLNDKDRSVGLFLDAVNELNRLFPGRRVKIGERLVKQQDLDVIDHDTGKADALLLTTGQLVGRISEMVFHVDKRCGPLGGRVHFRLGDTVVFKRKCNVFRDRQPDELAVRVLQDCADRFRKLKDAFFLGFHAVHKQLSGRLAGIAERNQAVDAACQRRFSAAGRPGNQNLLAGINVQIDVVQRGARLRTVLKCEIPKGNDGGVHGPGSSIVKSKRKGGRVTPCPRHSVHRIGQPAVRPGRHMAGWDHSLSSEPFLAIVLLYAATSSAPTMTAVRLLAIAANTPCENTLATGSA